MCYERGRRLPFRKIKIFPSDSARPHYSWPRSPTCPADVKAISGEIDTLNKLPADARPRKIKDLSQRILQQHAKYTVSLTTLATALRKSRYRPG
jgi:hypothetical protein